MQDLKFEVSSSDHQSIMALVRDVCDALRIRQKDLAASLDLKPSQMSVYFQGKVEMRTERLLSVLKILGIDVEQLLQDKLHEARGQAPSETTSDGKLMSLWGRLDHNQKTSLGRIIAQMSEERSQNKNSAELDGPLAVEKVKKELRRDHLFHVFIALPHLASDLPGIMHLAHQVGIPTEKAEKYLYALLSAGLWSVQGSQVKSEFDLLDSGESSPHEFLSLATELISRIPESAASNYDSYTLVTNRSLVRSFARKVNQGLKELFLKTENPNLEKDCVFSWAHAGVINLDKSMPVSKKTLEQ